MAAVLVQRLRRKVRFIERLRQQRRRNAFAYDRCPLDSTFRSLHLEVEPDPILFRNIYQVRQPAECRNAILAIPLDDVLNVIDIVPQAVGNFGPRRFETILIVKIGIIPSTRNTIQLVLYLGLPVDVVEQMGIHQIHKLQIRIRTRRMVIIPQNTRLVTPGKTVKHGHLERTMRYQFIVHLQSALCSVYGFINSFQQRQHGLWLQIPIPNVRRNIRSVQGRRKGGPTFCLQGTDHGGRHCQLHLLLGYAGKRHRLQDTSLPVVPHQQHLVPQSLRNRHHHRSVLIYFFSAIQPIVLRRVGYHIGRQGGRHVDFQSDGRFPIL